MAELLLILTIAGERVAFPAEEVESVIELEEVTPVPRTAPHVAGLSALRSRVLTVIDCRAALGLGSAGDDAREAVVVCSDGHAYALLVDAVEDVVEASGSGAPAGMPLRQGWARVARGTVEAGGDLLLLLVDPHALIAGPAREVAA